MKIQDFILEKMISKLIDLCKQELGLDRIPEISMVNEPTVGGDHSFGVFTGDAIQIVTKDRHPVDVMRTLAHELIHWKQRLEGKELDGTTGSDTENEANAVAGSIMRKFGEQNPEFFIL